MGFCDRRDDPYPGTDGFIGNAARRRLAPIRSGNAEAVGL